MLKSTQCKNLRIYFSFPQSLTEHIINYCTTDLLLQWNLWSGDTSAPQQKCPTEEVSPHHRDPLKRIETSGHNKTCWCRQVDNTMFHSLTHHSSHPDNIDSDKPQQVGPCPWCLYHSVCLSCMYLYYSGYIGMHALHVHICTVGLLMA